MFHGPLPTYFHLCGAQLWDPVSLQEYKKSRA